MIAVTFALPNESSDFVRRLTNGRLHGEEVRVLHTGVGEQNTRARLAGFFERETPRFLISAGFAGALTDELKPGDILVAENFSTAPLPALLKTDAMRRGRLETTNAILDSLGERASVAKKSDAMAVDMETRFIAEACARASVPMLSVRAISDSPAAPFGIPAHILFDLEEQRTPYVKLAFHLLRHPGAIGRLTLVARQVRTARIALTNALDAVISDCSRNF